MLSNCFGLPWPSFQVNTEPFHSIRIEQGQHPDNKIQASGSHNTGLTYPALACNQYSVLTVQEGRSRVRWHEQTGLSVSEESTDNLRLTVAPVKSGMRGLCRAFIVHVARTNAVCPCEAAASHRRQSGWPQERPSRATLDCLVCLDFKSTSSPLTRSAGACAACGGR